MLVSRQTHSIFGNCLSVGRLAPLLVGTLSLPLASRLKNNLLLSAEIGFVSLWCFMRAINC
jgi:hypothetical protein